MLLTHSDLADRQRFLNVRATLENLIGRGLVRGSGPVGTTLLGNRNTTEQLVSALVSSFTAVRQIAAGDKATCALRYDGKAYCWGANAQNNLGIGTSASYSTPQLVQCLP